jgi:purine-nucleoside phosphorylase
METAAVFRAAKIANLKLIAIFSVSDNVVENKSLISGRTKAEKNYRKETRKIVFPKIILELFKNK